jgi:hypothetical protein
MHQFFIFIPFNACPLVLQSDITSWQLTAIHHTCWQFAFFFFCCDPQYSMLSRTTKQLASTSHYPLVSCLILQYFISWLSEKSLSRDPITEAIKQKLWLRSPNQHTLSTHKLSPGPCRELTKPDSDTASPWPGFQRMSSCRWLNTSWQATDPFSFPRMITLRPKLFAERQVILVSSLQAPSELLMIQ